MSYGTAGSCKGVNVLWL